MKERKNHNSILVLATLGVYLGLVLAGATPQILAQAATTRQFDVKDEIEYKEDLDTKPDRAESILESDETDEKVSRAIKTFLAKFKPTIPVDAYLASEARTDTGLAALYWRSSTVKPSSSKHTPRLEHTITVSNFARADLDALLATSAK